MKLTGLLGKRLSHSYSPRIHALLGNAEYKLFEVPEDGVADFLTRGDWQALNVTIPYKKTVLPFLSDLSLTARRIGSVNTIVRRPDGTLFGDNTDVPGFIRLTEHAGISVAGKKVLVLGSGGASAAVTEALRQLSACPVVISRTGEDNYTNLERHRDASVIVNATPVGMYPDTSPSPIDLKCFPRLTGALDLIYNPARTTFLMQAERLGIPRENGLFMLISQAIRASEIAEGRPVPAGEAENILRRLARDMENIVLIGMPGAGKSTVARALASLTGRKAYDADDEITRETGDTPERIIRESGEDAFRAVESRVLRELGKKSGCVIATGGGAVTREENYASLHRNGAIVWLRRDTMALPRDGRPLSQAKSPEVLYRERKDAYARFADLAVDVAPDLTETAKAILKGLDA